MNRMFGRAGGSAAEAWGVALVENTIVRARRPSRWAVMLPFSGDRTGACTGKGDATPQDLPQRGKSFAPGQRGYHLGRIMVPKLSLVAAGFRLPNFRDVVQAGNLPYESANSRYTSPLTIVEADRVCGCSWSGVWYASEDALPVLRDLDHVREREVDEHSLWDFAQKSAMRQPRQIYFSRRHPLPPRRAWSRRRVGCRPPHHRNEPVRRGHGRSSD